MAPASDLAALQQGINVALPFSSPSLSRPLLLSTDTSFSENLSYFVGISLRMVCLVSAAASGFATTASDDALVVCT